MRNGFWRGVAMSLYDDLGVARDAPADAVNEAYRRMAKRHHPDAGGDPEAFARIGHAVSVLRDPVRRAEYDATGREDFTEVSPDAEALAMLSAKFGEAMNAFILGQVPLWSDLIGRMRTSLDAMAAEQRKGVSEGGDALRRVNDALERLGHDGTGPDVLRGMLTTQVASIEQALAAMTAQIATIESARVLAERWTWKADAYAAEPRTMSIQELMRGGGYTFVGGGGFTNIAGI